MDGNGNGSMEMVRRFRTLFELGAVGTLSDGQLLGRFAGRSGMEAEAPFEALVERHGPMVLRACRAILRDEHEAEDAFQATFLVLARRARTLWVRDSIAPWLHQVACRTAHAARLAAARRRALERRAAALAPPAFEDGHDPADDLNPALHEEVRRLPDRFRRPLVLCYLEGLTHDQAARALGWPVGTVRSRLARGRARLKGRLVRRGLAPALGLGLAGSTAARAELPAALVASTVRAAASYATGPATAAGLASATAVALSEGVLRTMFLAKTKLLACGLVAAGLLATGTAAVARRPRGDEPKQATSAPATKEQGVEEKPSIDPTAAYVLQRLHQKQARLLTQKARVAQLTEELAQARKEFQILEASVAAAREQIRRQLRVASLPEDPGVVKGSEADPAGTAKAVPEAQDPTTRARLREVVNDEASLVRLQAERERLRAEMATQAADLKVVEDDLARLRERIRSRRQALDPREATPPAAGPDGARAGSPRAEDRAGSGEKPGGEAERPARKRNYQPLIGSHYFESSTADDRATIFNVRTRTARSVRLKTPEGQRLESIQPVGDSGLIGLQLYGTGIARLAAFDPREERWHALDLEKPVSGNVAPIVGQTVLAYVFGQRIYAFSGVTKTWDVLVIPPNIQATTSVHPDQVNVSFNNGRVHKFEAKTGSWGVSPDDRSVLDSIPIDDEEGDR